jgi:hypothetical protein
MDWGTERVLEQQMTVGKKLGLKMKLLSQSLNDVVSLSITTDNLIDSSSQ